MTISIVKQEQFSLAHRTEFIYYEFLPSAGGGDVQVVRTGKIGKRWRHVVTMTREEARALWTRLKTLGYEEDK